MKQTSPRRQATPAAQHPVWVVYDRLRTARLNVKYYGIRADWLQSLNQAMEVMLLITAPTSVLTGIAFWNTAIGKPVWQTLGIIAGLVAMMKPVFRFPARIRDYESTISGYRALDYDLSALREKIEQHGRYDETLQSEYNEIVARFKATETGEPEKVANKKIRDACTEEVLRELPVGSFYIPADG